MDEEKVAWLEFILQYAFNSEHIARYMCDRVGVDHIETEAIGGSLHHRILYANMLNYYQKHKEYTIPFDILKGNLAKSIKIYFDKFPGNAKEELIQSYKDSLVKLFKKVTSPTVENGKNITDYSDGIVTNVINNYYASLVLRPSIVASAQDAASSDQLDVDKFIDDVKNTASKVGRVHVPVNPFSLEGIEQELHIPPGIKWVAKLLHGGWKIGNSYSFIAKSGHGKTTFLTQCAVALASKGLPTAIVYTEQSASIELDMKAKFWSLVLNKTTKELKSALASGMFSLDNLSEPERRELEVVTNNLSVYDFSVNRGDINDLRSIAVGNMGPKPQVLFVDWAGEFAKQLIESDPRYSRSSAPMNYALIEIANCMAHIARDAEIATVISHQMKPGVGDSINKRYDHTMSEDCKNFSKNISYAGVICPLDENNTTRIDMTKTRYDEKTTQVVKLNGPYSRFDALEGYRAGRRVYERAGASNKLPDAGSGGSPGGFLFEG